MSYFIVIVLVLLSGIFSGLTLGFLGLDKSELERKSNLGNKRAKKIYSVRKQGNLLLCTLLIGNVAVNATLSIFLGGIVSGVVAGFLATGLIVIFGEIIPQAVFSRYAMEYGSKIVWLVKFFIFILYPAAFPLAWFLDKLLGEERRTIWSRAELKEIIKEHEDSKRSDLDADEERIMLGALSFSNKKVADVMTPRLVVFALDKTTILDEKTLKQIKERGFSRIPVYDKEIDNIKGVLYVKDLLGIKPGVKVEEIYKPENFIVVLKSKKIDNLLNDFYRQKIHIAIVVNKYGSFEGVITLEDIIEEVFKLEIVDETDEVEDLQVEAKKKAERVLKVNQLMRS